MHFANERTNERLANWFINVSELFVCVWIDFQTHKSTISFTNDINESPINKVI